MNELLHSLDWVLPLRSDELTPLMRFFTRLGYEKFILFFLPLGYWAWHRGVFLRLLVLVAFTALLNAWLKDFWQDPRPPVALRMDHEVGDSFGLPSGHAQIAIVIWLWLAWELRRGWAWLVAERGKLKVVKTPNADTPLAHGQKALLTCDVWEHAYYLDYQDRRKDFVTMFLDKLSNWDFAEAQLVK